jgi:iron(III) transport system permease protein
VIPIARRWLARLAVLPLAVLLGLTSIPLFSLLGRFSSGGPRIDWFSFGPTVAFAMGGAVVAVAAGGMLGILLGTRAFPGHRWLLALSVVPIAAPPAFWWIGATRLPTGWADLHGLGAAAIVTGLALSPITLLLVFAALRQMPSNIYQSARIALPPLVRLRAVLIPLLIAPLAGGFLLTVILLLGESEMPFLFGFRTAMTDVVTTFAQTFDVRSTVPLIVPLLLVILVLGGLAGRLLVQSIFAAARGTHGVVPVPGSGWLTLWAALPAVSVAVAIAGYGWALFAPSIEWTRFAVDPWSTAASIAEPVGCAWTALILTVAASYPARRSRGMHAFLWAGLLLFCVPAAIYAIGWLALSQRAGGVAIPPAVAHTSRAVALCTLGFAVGYSRLPPSMDDAAALVPVSHVARASLFVLPLVVPSLAASAALSAAMTYADRDVASLLLSPGASRLTLNLYLASANAPSATIGVLALAVLGGAAITVVLAAAGPALILRRRRD